MNNRYQSGTRKSKGKFEVVGGREVALRLPLPLLEAWEEWQAEVERLTGQQAGLEILCALLEDEVRRRVGPPHRPDPVTGCVGWGWQPISAPELTSARSNSVMALSGEPRFASVLIAMEKAWSDAVHDPYLNVGRRG